MFLATAVTFGVLHARTEFHIGSCHGITSPLGLVKRSTANTSVRMHADQYNFDDDDAQMTPRRMAGGMNYATDRRRRGSTHPPSHVLATRSQPLGLGEQSVRGPIALGPSAAAGRPLRFFNPSIAPSPPHLCRRCAYLATLRADVLHQCDTSTPLRSRLQGPTNGFFKGTALAALDADLAVLGWTWLLIDPGEQVLGRTDGRSNRSDYFVRRGSAGAFPPPWSAHAIDTRLHSFDGTHLLATFVRSCHARQPCSFGVSQLHVTAEPTPDGGLEQMRAWVHPDYWNGKHFIPKRQLPALLSFIGASRFAYMRG